MNAIILADFGPMITPLTDDCPKSMLKIANVPLLDYSFSQLNYYGFKDITFVSAIKNDKAMNYIASFKGLNCRFYDKACSDFGLEKLKAEYHSWEDISVVIKCDSVNDIDLFKLIYTHLESGAEITMAVVPQKNKTQIMPYLSTRIIMFMLFPTASACLSRKPWRTQAYTL